VTEDGRGIEIASLRRPWAAKAEKHPAHPVAWPQVFVLESKLSKIDAKMWVSRVGDAVTSGKNELQKYYRRDGASESAELIFDGAFRLPASSAPTGRCGQPNAGGMKILLPRRFARAGPRRNQRKTFPRLHGRNGSSILSVVNGENATSGTIGACSWHTRQSRSSDRGREIAMTWATTPFDSKKDMALSFYRARTSARHSVP